LPMWRATPLGVLVLAAISRGMTIEGPSNQVSIEATGALQTDRIREAHRDDSPFVLDTAVSLSSAAATTPADDSPFEMDSSFSPFVVDDKPKAQPGTASGIQSSGQAGMNDSPFVLESQAEPAHVSPHPGPAATSPFVADSAAVPHAAAAAASPFVMEAQAPATSAATRAATVSTPSQGDVTFVRNGDLHAGPPPPSPDTTRMVMQFPDGQTTTGGPTTSTALRFELGGAILELSPGQKFVPVPDTPFEMESHVAVALLLKQNKKAIELLKPASLLEGAAPPRRAPRLMRGEELQSAEDPAGVRLEVRRGLILPVHMAPEEEQLAQLTGPTDIAKVPSATPVAVVAPAPLAKVAVPQRSRSTAASQPAKSTLNTAAARPLATTNRSLSAPEKIFNATFHDVIKNNTNANGLHTPKVITVRGAIISIVCGFIVTVFFLSMLLCALKAGNKDVLENVEQEEPPAAAARSSYRQLLKAQKLPEASQAVTSSPRSV